MLELLLGLAWVRVELVEMVKAMRDSLHMGCIADSCTADIYIITQQNYIYEVATNNFMVGESQQHEGTVLKGHTIDKVENH